MINDQITYLFGDIFVHLLNVSGNVVLPHVCNNKGGWGAGFVVPLGRIYPASADRYHEWAMGVGEDKQPFQLGETQFVQVSPTVNVANMLAQNGFRGYGNSVPLDYDALAKCMKEVAKVALELSAKIHCPRFGAGLGGGDWKIIEKMIMEHWVSAGIAVTVHSIDMIEVKNAVSE